MRFPIHKSEFANNQREIAIEIAIRNLLDDPTISNYFHNTALQEIEKSQTQFLEMSEMEIEESKYWEFYNEITVSFLAEMILKMRYFK